METDSILKETTLCIESILLSSLLAVNMGLTCEHVMLRIISSLVQFIKSVYLISSFSIYKVFSGNNKTERKKRETSGSVNTWNIIFLVSL